LIDPCASLATNEIASKMVSVINKIGFFITFHHGVINLWFVLLIPISGMEAAKARRKIRLNTNEKAGRERLALSQLYDIIEISSLRFIADE
jgi:hypothetical protein